MTVRFPPDWNDLLRCLNLHRVRFVIIGAHALAAIGIPRNTLDLDVFVEATTANAVRLQKALTDFGFSALAAQALQFARGDRMAVLGREPFRIDLLNAISGVSFREAWSGAEIGKLGAHRVRFLGRKQFIKNKKAAGRPKDRLDLALLDEAQPRARRGKA